MACERIKALKMTPGRVARKGRLHDNARSSKTTMRMNAPILKLDKRSGAEKNLAPPTRSLTIGCT
jgi:hypothetical protein